MSTKTPISITQGEPKVTVATVEQCRYQIRHAVGQHHISDDVDTLAEEFRVKAERTGRYTPAAIRALVRIVKAEHTKNQEHYYTNRF